MALKDPHAPGSLDPSFDRRSGIGASESAAIAGLSPFATALDIYNLKVGVTQPSADTPWMKAGRYLEPAIARFYADERGVELEGDGSKTFRHKDHPFILASPDRWVRGGKRGVEIKNVGQWMAKNWGDAPDAVPEHIVCQAVQQMAVMGFEDVDVVPLIGGNALRVYTIAFDPDLWAMLLALGERFWNAHVIPRRPPEMDGSSGGWAFLAATYARPLTATVREATAQETALVLDFHTARAKEKEWKARKDLLAQQVRLAIGDDLGIGVKGEWAAKAAWQKEAEVKAFTRKAGRVLRVSGKSLPADEE